MHALFTWLIAAVTLVAIVARPFGIAEWIWSVCGAAVLVAGGMLSGRQAGAAAQDGLEVYCFLAGMLALAEILRVHGVFERLAHGFALRARGNTGLLFAYWFGGAIAVTALLSNDGTILLLTPAAIALARHARTSLQPFAYAVAFVANAASFILPISNPANLLVFAPLPHLLPWLSIFAVPSVLALACTYAVLRGVYRAELRAAADARGEALGLCGTARFAAIVTGFSLAVLVLAAGLGWPVGYVALGMGVCAVACVGLRERNTPQKVLREAPWPVIPLVAGLFVIVRAFDVTGALGAARAMLVQASAMQPLLGGLYAGGVTTVADALINNLPAGVIARYALRGHGIAPHVSHAVLIGVDLGPNLWIGGSLATLLWAMMLRREGVEVSARRFLALGVLVTLPALALALAVVR